MSNETAPHKQTIIEITSLGKRYDIAPEGGSKREGFVRSLKHLIGNQSLQDGTRSLWALRDFNLRIQSGSVTGVIGRNGAGKTTLLRILGRITSPTEGRIEGWGRIFPMLEVGASFHPEFTARENVFFNAAMFGVPREEVRRKFDQIIEFSGIGDRIDDKVRDMSTGTYIRLAFSLAVNMRPDLLLADEVLAVGDAEFQEACLQRIRQEKERGMSVVFVSHDMAAVASICDRVVWIDNGIIRKVGATDEVIASYEHDLWQGKSGQVGDPARTSRPVNVIAARTLGKAGREVSSITQENEIHIELIFAMHCPGAVVTPGVDVFTSKTQLMSMWAEKPVRLTAPGVYSAMIKVPPWMFTARKFDYRVSLRAAPSEGDPYVDELDAKLRFRVHGIDRPDPDGKQQKRARAGYIAPQLDWRMRTESSPSVTQKHAVGL